MRNLSDTILYSVEHGDIEVVAVNDPFIEPKYAVSEHPRNKLWTVADGCRHTC